MPGPPIFIVAGMPRTGTTFLYYYLSRHPAVFAPARKEVNYYSVFYERERAWYDSLYDDLKPGQTGIDASPFYYLDERSAQRIATDQPDAKVILGIRKPTELVCSIYERIDSSTIAMPSFDQFLEAYHWDIGSGLTLSFKQFPFLQRIKEYQALFGERLLLYDFEVMDRDPLKLLNTVEQHLGIEQHFNEDNFSNLIINASKRRNNKRLAQFLKNEKLIDALVGLLPRKLINQSRDVFLRATQPRNPKSKAPLNAANLALAQSLFSRADEGVAALFEQSAFLLGNGQPLNLV